MTAIIPCLWNVIRHSQERTRFVQSCRQLLRVASRVDKKYQRCFNVVSTNLDLSPFVSCASFRKSEGQERGEQNPLCYCLIKGNAIWERISSRNAKFWFRITKSHAIWTSARTRREKLQSRHWRLFTHKASFLRVNPPFSCILVFGKILFTTFTMNESHLRVEMAACARATVWPQSRGIIFWKSAAIRYSIVWWTNGIHKEFHEEKEDRTI